MSWTILEYVNDGGEGAIAEWLNSLPAGTDEDVRAALDTTLQLLQPAEYLRRPQGVGKLGNKLGSQGKGLYELRFKAAKVQRRPIFCYLPGRRRTIVVLIGAEEKGARLVPSSACTTAQYRRTQLTQPGRLREYDYQ